MCWTPSVKPKSFACDVVVWQPFCLNCRAYGHVKTQCPHPKKPYCHSCRVEGHTGRTCPLLICATCGGCGHKPESCPTKPPEFNDVILEWPTTPSTLARPYFFRTRFPEHAITATQPTVEEYQAQYVPHVLEEARAIIHAGLVSRTPVIARLQVKGAAKKTSTVTLFTVLGHVPQDYDDGLSDIAVKLALPLLSGPVDQIGLLSVDRIGGNGQQSQWHLRVAIKSSGDSGAVDVSAFIGRVLNVHVLGSVLSCKRMFVACTRPLNVPFAKKLATGRLSSSSGQAAFRGTSGAASSGTTDALNREQQAAVNTILTAVHGGKPGVVMLQGPPGTGKTTTLSELVQELIRGGFRVAIAAPSNKAVQVIASKLATSSPMLPMLLAGVHANMHGVLREYVPELAVDVVVQALQDLSALLDGMASQGSAVTSKLRESHPDRNLKAKVKTICTLWDRPSRVLDSRFPAVALGLRTLSDSVGVVSPASLREQAQTVVGLLRTVKATVDSEAAAASPLIAATLAVYGRHKFQEAILSGLPVDVLIIDEAAQAVEAECLIPLALCPRVCVLVGDVKQLPATVISDRAVHNHFEWSMMHRLQVECRQVPSMLSQQYRMHPSIQDWPSRRFYNSELVPARSVLSRPLPLGWKGIEAQWSPYTFVDVVGEESSAAGSTSKYNLAEAAAIGTHVLKLHRQHGIAVSSIGIVTFYAAQVEAIKKSIKVPGITVSTVDAYQVRNQD